jgi:hypothetical protein
MRKFLNICAALSPVFLVVAVAGVVGRLEDSRKLPYRESDEAIVDQAITAYKRDHPRATGLGARFPVVTRTDVGRCVNLTLPRGYIGVIPWYCFDELGKLKSKGEV